jgi:hypothetical protein
MTPTAAGRATFQRRLHVFISALSIRMALITDPRFCPDHAHPLRREACFIPEALLL